MKFITVHEVRIGADLKPLPAVEWLINPKHIISVTASATGSTIYLVVEGELKIAEKPDFFLNLPS